MKKFELFEHGADIGVRGFGKTMNQAFENAALAMFSIEVLDIEDLVATCFWQLSCESYDQEALLTAWLNTLISYADLYRVVFCSFDVTIADCTLTARVGGVPLNELHGEKGVEVKGATFTELYVSQRDDAWIAQCVVDV
ncbi:MAG: archease [Dissulfuribacterales bacterium]